MRKAIKAHKNLYTNQQNEHIQKGTLQQIWPVADTMHL